MQATVAPASGSVIARRALVRAGATIKMLFSRPAGRTVKSDDVQVHLCNHIGSRRVIRRGCESRQASRGYRQQGDRMGLKAWGEVGGQDPGIDPRPPNLAE